MCLNVVNTLAVLSLQAQIKSISGKLLTVVYESRSVGCFFFKHLKLVECIDALLVWIMNIRIISSPQEEVAVYCDSVRPPPPKFSCHVAVGDEVEVRTTRITDGSMNSGLLVVVGQF